jgi:hypothetical protein
MSYKIEKIVDEHKITKEIIDGGEVNEFEGNLTMVINTSGSASYTHEQASGSTNWLVTHNLGKKPHVTVTDSAGTEIIGAITYPSLNQVSIEFSNPETGYAYIS